MIPLQKRYEEAINTLTAYQTAVNVAAIVSMTDVKGRIVLVNDKFIEISGFSENELIGNTHKLINSGYHTIEFFKEMWRTISKGKTWKGEIRNKRKDGSFYWVDTVITPLFDSTNCIFRYLSIRNLITDRKEIEKKLLHSQQELIKSEQQLKDAQQVARIGSWYLENKGNVLEWSDEAYHIFGIPVKMPMTYEKFLEKVHPDDRTFVNEQWQAALKGAPYQIEHRIIVEQEIKWVKENARLEFDASNSFMGATGTVQDITERKNIEINLKESELLHRQLFDNIPVPVAIVDKESLRFKMVNETAKTLYGYSNDEFLQLTLYDIRVEEEHRLLKSLLDSDKYAQSTSIRTHRKKNGELLHIEPVIREIEYKGSPAYLISIVDMTEKLVLQREIVQAKVTRQKEINRAYMDAQEENRAAIGRELHDNVNQLLVASMIFLKTMSPQSAKDAETKEKTLEIISSAMSEIRKLTQSTVPPSLNELSLKESLEGLSYNLLVMNKKVEFDINIIERQFEEGFLVNLYRIIQEEFSNIVKYSEATEVKLSLHQNADTLTLEIADNGKGFDLKTRSRGIGLTNIAHRAETYNGELVIESSPGAGCRLHIVFKLDNAAM